MGMNDFAPSLKQYGCFVVRNVTADRGKTIKIFNYPIPFNTTRDLLQIPGVGEADLRASLLKGELRHKILAKDIIVECSDIDLLQFNLDQKMFLQNAGIINGLEIGINNIDLRQLIFLADGVGGPMEGFLSGSFREILPSDSAYPSSIIWWDSGAKIFKIVEKNITYDSIKRPTMISWKSYSSGGNLMHTIIDTISYNGSSIFESTRTRTVT